MTGLWIALGVVVVLGLVVLMWGVGIYNSLVRIRQHLKDSWAGVDVELKRRYDLIPNLVNTVKGYASHTQFISLQGELSETENRIASARRLYNGNVRDMNTAVETFPSVIIAGMFNFEKAEYFEIEDAAVRDAPQVSF